MDYQEHDHLHFILTTPPTPESEIHVRRYTEINYLLRMLLVIWKFTNHNDFLFLKILNSLLVELTLQFFKNAKRLPVPHMSLYLLAICLVKQLQQAQKSIWLKTRGHLLDEMDHKDTMPSSRGFYR